MSFIGAPLPEFLFHGTSNYVLEQIRAGTNVVIPVYQDSNVSLGGTYMTTNLGMAKVAAAQAARVHGSAPVIVCLRPDFALQPDEDWVVCASENPRDEHFDGSLERYTVPRYERFFNDLFSRYLGEGQSLSDAYVKRYATLNRKHQITWEDSMLYLGSVRQDQPIAATQIIDRWSASLSPEDMEARRRALDALRTLVATQPTSARP